MRSEKSKKTVEKEQKEDQTSSEQEPEQIQDPIENPLAEMRDLLQRTQANFENYRKQTEKRVEEFQELANKDLILQILPVLDNFELALKNTENKEEFIKGIELIYSQLFTMLKDNGIKTIEAKKEQQFDPYIHEALMKENSELPENAIIEEFQKGFMLNEKVIRHAKVKLSSGKGCKCPNDNKTKK
ncbi:MAG: nucleotide exchange factor GrpE [archaeon]